MRLWSCMMFSLDDRSACVLVWVYGRIITQDELARFYQAFIEVTFKHSLKRVFLTSKVRAESDVCLLALCSSK